MRPSRVSTTLTLNRNCWEGSVERCSPHFEAELVYVTEGPLTLTWKERFNRTLVGWVHPGEILSWLQLPGWFSPDHYAALAARRHKPEIPPYNARIRVCVRPCVRVCVRPSGEKRLPGT
jgi:hypothetical protein